MRPVYPRWRGEHSRAVTQSLFFSGLSPLARGTPPRTHEQTITDRFIPAGAGNTQTITRVARGSSVYPRWRGEHYQTGIFPYNGGGLSPLARGTLTRRGTPYSFRTLHEICRFIPAGAGNTEIADSNKMEFSVYPRWRGEHTLQISGVGNENGLSPLARGTH